MPDIRHGMELTDIRPFVDEAIASLKLVRAESASWLSEMAAIYATRNQGRSIREAGTRLSKTERNDLGIPPEIWGHLSREAWCALTDLGKCDPISAFDDTVSRAITNARNFLRGRAAKKVLRNDVFAGVIMTMPPAIGVCEVGEREVGKFLEEPPALPFLSCDRRVCRCSWRVITKREKDRLGL